MSKLGVVIVGVNGAVATTLIAGVALMKRGLVPRIGMVTERSDAKIAESLTELLNFAPIEDMVFGGWDLRHANAYEAALTHKVFPASTLEPVAEELKNQKAWPAVFSKQYSVNVLGDSVVAVGTMREEIRAIQHDIEEFKRQNRLDRVVMVNLASTEAYLAQSDVHGSLAAFEKGLDANDKAITPAMRYFYASTSLGIPYCNFAPSLTNVPALSELAAKTKTPYAGMDGKTGQTLVKTALAAMFRVRRLQIDGWFSTNVLGNNDGLILDSPESNKTKVLSKKDVLDSIVGYEVPNHQVHIHYYKPRGDSKEAWDNIDITGFAGIQMQMKIDFLCQDSGLAAPLVLDLVRLLDVAKSAGDFGIQRQLSMFFKSPYHEAGETPVHDVFKQEQLLLKWANEKSKTQSRTHSHSSPVANSSHHAVVGNAE